MPAVAAPAAVTTRATDTAAHVSPWMRRAAHAAALTVLPSCLWRLVMAAGVPLGFGVGSPHHHAQYPGWGSLALVALCVLQECLGLASLGLVQRWGEEVPRWVPVLGGRRIHRLLVAIPFALAAVAVTVLACAMAWFWNGVNAGDPTAPRGLGYWAMTLSYVPVLLWGPLLAVLSAAYWCRRRTHG
ncbi:hypothetical protein ACGFZK_15540 [Streptomyces sp. NPDC048257]|uniref:hypothetical protein n=1 Tax=Streptomyces sp. NPDC048257 TaxID=3365526 RepID=UPI00370FEDDA